MSSGATNATVEPPSGEIKGSGVIVWVDGDAVMIKYSVLYYGFLGTKRVPVENIKSFTWNEPGNWISGWLELVVLGEQAPSVHASPNVQRQNRLKFDQPQRDVFAQLKAWIEARTSVQHVGAGVLPSAADELTKLADLVDRGLLTAEEFAAQKGKILGS